MDEKTRELIKVRLEKAEEDIKTAKELKIQGGSKSFILRAVQCYYGCIAHEETRKIKTFRHRSSFQPVFHKEQDY